MRLDQRLPLADLLLGALIPALRLATSLCAFGTAQANAVQEDLHGCELTSFSTLHTLFRARADAGL